MSINFHQLRCFHAVALHGSFTAAARSLFIGQPSITTHVKALEQRFGIELFYRHGHIVELTHTGHKLMVMTMRIFTLEAETEETLRAAGGLLEGKIRISAFDPVQVTRMAAAFGLQYPEVMISVAFGNIGELRDNLLELKADVAILPQLGDQRFFTIPYRRARISLLVGLGHAWSERHEVQIRDLEGQRIVTRESASMQRKVFDTHLEEAGVSVRRVLEIDSQEAVREAIAYGMGIGILLDVGNFKDPRFRVIEIADTPMFIDMEIGCLAERREAPVIKAFFDVVRRMQDGKESVN